MASHDAGRGADLGRRARAPAGFTMLVVALVTFTVAERGVRADASAAYETVVRAPSKPDDRGREDRAASASVVTADRTPRSGESVAQLVSELPGVQVNRIGGLGSMATLSIRGSTPNQVQVYLDGVPLTLAAGGGADLALLPIGDLARLELYRGQSPIAFGASAIGGVLSVTSQMPERTGGGAYLGAGAFGTRSAGGTVAWAGTRLRLSASAHHLASEGNFTFANDWGTPGNPADDRTSVRNNNDLGQIDGGVRAHVLLPGRRTLLAGVTALGRGQGVPGPAGQIEANEVRFGFARLIAQTAYESRDDLGPGGLLRASAYVMLVEQRLRDAWAELHPVPTDTRDRTTAVGSTLRASFLATDWLRLAGLADGRFERFAPFDAKAAFPTGAAADRVSGALGGEATIDAEALRLTLVPSARLEVARDEVSSRNPFTDEPSALSPSEYVLPVARFAVVQRPSDWLSLKANVGRYARLPSTTERYGNTGFLRPNPALRPERAWNGDLGFSISAGERRTLVVDGAVFASLVEDLIAMQALQRGQSAAVNVDRARVLGGELALQMKLAAFRLFAQGTYTDARDTGSAPAYENKQLPLRPRLRAYARPELRLAATRRNEVAFGLWADADHTSGAFGTRANDAPLPARLLFGAGAYADHPASGLRVALSAFNLTDAQAHDYFAYPLPGRSVFLTLGWTSPSDS